MRVGAFRDRRKRRVIYDDKDKEMTRTLLSEVATIVLKLN
jgi:hypothetical protein